MKLLIITQKVDINDDILGFFHNWIEEFAKHYEKVTVICLYKGEYNLPENVKVLSLGKEKSVKHSVFDKIKYVLKFYKYIWRERKNYDNVFVLMNPEYVILGGLFWKLWKKKIALWYTHKRVDLKLRLAEKLVDKIFTASKESFSLPSKKVEITGHGIDSAVFQPRNQKSNLKNQKFSIITAGRIAPVKNIDVLIEVAEILPSSGWEIKIAGRPILESDEKYFERLKIVIKEKKLDDKIKFIGPVPNKDIAEFYQNGDLFVNFSDTGSLDKAVLEAIASGLEVLTSNKAFASVLGGEIFIEKNPEKIAQKIIEIASSRENKSNQLAKYIFENHNLDNLVNKIINFYEQIA